MMSFVLSRRMPLLLLLLGFLLPTLMPGAWAGEAVRHAVVQRFEPARDNGTPIVVVRFSDTVTGRFLVDTGEVDCLMTDAFAKRLGLPQELSRRYLLGALLSATPPPKFVSVPALTIGGLKITGAEFLMVSPRRLPVMGGQPVDGILGGPLLSRFALLLDYPRHNLVWITPGNLDDKAVAALGFGPENAVPLSQEMTVSGLKVNHYSAHTELKAGDQTRAEDMTIDTGSPFSSLSYDTARRLKLTPLRRHPFDLFLMGAGAQSAELARVPALQLGGLSLPDVSVLYPENKDVFLPPLLGENILSGSFSLFDFGPHRFYLKPVLPWVTARPLPPLDPNAVDWDRLRRAPDLPTVQDVLRAGLTPEAFESRPERVARLRAGLAGGAVDAAGYARLGALMRAGLDDADARAALDTSIGLLKADAQAHPEDETRAAAWASALLAAGRDEEAASALQKATEKNPASALLWRTLGLAQETQAARGLLGTQMKAVTDILDADLGSPDLDAFSEAAPAKQEPAQAEQTLADCRQARDSYDRAVSLAPQDPEGYGARAVFEALDYYLHNLLCAQGYKDKALSPETDLAGLLADSQNYARLKPEDPDALRRAATLDLVLPRFHDRGWLRDHLSETERTLADGPLMTAPTAQARLAALGRSGDKSLAAPALAALGTVQNIQDDAGAETSWRQALALDPAQPEALRGLAGRFLLTDRLGDLRALLTAQLPPDSAPSVRTLPARLLLAATLLTLGSPGDAEAQARLALRSAPDNPTVNLLLAGLLLSRSEGAPDALAEAGRCLATAQAGIGPLAGAEQAEGGPQARLQTMQAVLLALTGDPTSARGRLLEIVRTQPTCTQAREALAALTPLTTAAP